MELGNCLQQLAERELLPARYEAALVVASVARGWDSPASDLDLCLVTTDPWTGRADQRIRIATSEQPVPAVVCHVAGQRWDVKYWLDSQVAAVIEAVSHERLASGAYADDDLTETEELFLARILLAVPLGGVGWLAECQELVRASAFRTICVTRSLNLMDQCTEDAVGLLEAADPQSAVLSAKNAFRHAVAAVLADCGEMSKPKWNVRAFQAATPKVLSFSDYWAIETMRGFDPLNPGAWVEEVLTVCQRISMEIEI